MHYIKQTKQFKNYEGKKREVKIQDYQYTVFCLL